MPPCFSFAASLFLVLLSLLAPAPLAAQQPQTRLEKLIEAVRQRNEQATDERSNVPVPPEPSFPTDADSDPSDRSNRRSTRRTPLPNQQPKLDLDPAREDTSSLIGDEARIPLDGPSPEDVSIERGANGTVSVVARNATISDILDSLAQAQGLNLVIGATAGTQQMSISLKDVPVQQAIEAVVGTAGLTCVRKDNIMLVTTIESGQNNLPSVQNRELRVFDLDYASVPDVEASVQRLLSPAGQVTVLQSATRNIRQTRDLIVVEDLKEFVDRIAMYIEQIDQPPRQVLIEARVLQVRLTDDYVHGVNLLYKLASGEGSTLTVAAKGFANTLAPQAMLFTLSSKNLNDAVELIENTLDSKTLASPRVLALNGQESRIQVGGQLGFRVLTTTQTSTLEQVQFLNTGVILRVTPYITRDGQIMMTVQPSVSTGQINTQGLPEAQTTEVATHVLLPDNHGMIIGGLIQETYEDKQSKIPVLGDVKLIGRLFQRRQVNRNRAEIIIALIPRIVPYDCPTADRDREELARTDASIFQGPLARNPRPWEPRLYDARENPRNLKKTIHHHGRMRTDNKMTYAPYPTNPASQAGLEGVPPAAVIPAIGPSSRRLPIEYSEPGDFERTVEPIEEQQEWSTELPAEEPIDNRYEEPVEEVMEE